MATIAVRRAQLAPSEARGRGAPCEWRRGAGALANKSPTSEIMAANKQTGGSQRWPGFF